MRTLLFRHRETPRKLASALFPGSGPAERLEVLRKLVTNIVRHERVEHTFHRLAETRQYTELLIQQAIQYGDRHQPTMEIADYWLLEKDLIPKLFKVLAPRYQTYSTSFTKLFRLPPDYPGLDLPKAVLELRGNPWPPMIAGSIESDRRKKHFLVNILLDAAKADTKRQPQQQPTTKTPTPTANTSDNDKKKTE